WQIYRAKGLNVIGVDRDEPLEVVKEFAKTMKITYPLALDPGANVFSLFAERNSGVTRNIVIDKSGKIAFLTRLYNPIEFQEMIGVIDRLLKE
ncbi:MAG: TlpA family protein disulfide reductase, partial [Candidatus Marinimicrobia bacterium]|nr:TlpA family protein disulfide reductase [Candidatus Neomarinimicrobiota bacterium]